jgi:hypothetical protein
MSLRTGTVRPDGTSTLIHDGIYDMASAPQEELPPELEARLQKALAAYDPRETQAKFKLEVFFKGGPRKNVPVRGVIACWTNGGYLSGGGDASVYLCPQEVGPEHVCMAPLDLQFAAGGRVVCTRCRRVSKTDTLIGQIINEVPLTRWASILVRLFHVLDCSADLRICVERGSLRIATALETMKNRGGEEYAAVAAKREWMTYPLANIIKDTASGSGLEQRFRAFLEA